MGIRKIVVLAHEWEAYYKDEFRRAARLARELSIAIEPYFENEDPRFSVNSYEGKEIDPKLYHDNPNIADEYDAKDAREIHDEN